MHRDIKNENILVNSDGVYKLADFGEACQLSGSATNMTIRGTMDYMAPEMLLGRAVGYTADLYGLGLVLYRLVNHNRFPFSREGEINRQGANMKRISGEPVPPPNQASEAFASVILRALAFDPKDRWQNAEDMGRALREITETGKPMDDVHKKIQAKPLIGIYQIQDEKAVAYTEDTTFDLSTLQPGTYASFLFRLSNDSETPLKITSACARIDGGKELGWGGFSLEPHHRTNCHIFYSHMSSVTPGTHKVDFYINGSLIKSASFTLKSGRSSAADPDAEAPVIDQETVNPEPAGVDPKILKGILVELAACLPALGREETGMRLKLLKLGLDAFPQKSPDVVRVLDVWQDIMLLQQGKGKRPGESASAPKAPIPEVPSDAQRVPDTAKEKEVSGKDDGIPEKDVFSERDIVVQLMVSREACENGFTEYVRYYRTIRCSACRGTGLLSGMRCRMCQGKGRRQEGVVQPITVPPHPGRQRFLFSVPGQGHAGEKGEPDGSLLVKVYVREPDKVPDAVRTGTRATRDEKGTSGKPSAFVPGQRQDGSDVHCDLRITPYENRTGCRKTMSYLQRKRCTSCSGKGVQARGICPVCGGKGAFEAAADVEVTLSPRPTSADYSLLFRGKGHEGVNGGRDGNLLIRVHPG